MSIAKRPNGKYRARYRDAEGKEHARHFDRRIDAQRWLASQVTKVTDGTWVDPAKGKRTFGEFAKQWQKAQLHHRASTTRITTYRLNRLVEQFGNRPLSSITRTDVQGWVSSLEMAPSSVEVHYRLLAQIMLAAVEERLLAASPCRRVNLPKRDHQGPTIPAVEDLEAIVANASDHGRAAVVVAAGAGLRVSELLGLTVDRVDFLRGVITVDRQLVSPVGPTFGPTKTKGSNRKIPIPRSLAETIGEHLARFPSDDLIFRTQAGRPWHRGRFSDEWRRWCSAAGVQVRFHDLRHLYASSLIAAGQSVKVVQERLGHTSASTTLDVYGHLFPADEDATREAIDTSLATVLRTVRGL